MEKLIVLGSALSAGCAVELALIKYNSTVPAEATEEELKNLSFLNLLYQRISLHIKIFFREMINSLAAFSWQQALLSCPWYRDGLLYCSRKFPAALAQYALCQLSAFCQLMWLFTCVMTGLLFHSFVSAIVVAAGAFGLMYILGQKERSLRAQERLKQIPELYRSLSGALASGLSLVQALTHVADRVQGELGQAFRRMVLHLQCGSSIEEALAYLESELQSEEIHFLTTALLISQRTGSSLERLFGRSAQLVEQQIRFKRSVEVKTAQARLSLKIVSILPVLIVMALSLLSRDFQQGLLSMGGFVSVLCAALLDAFALAIIHRLMSEVTQ